MRRQEDTARLPLSRWLLLAALLACAAAAAYLPLAHAGFVWDDDAFLTANPLIRAPDGLRRFWFTTQASDYWPVTSTTLWLEWRLWGMNALGYHYTNLALHVFECLLLWAILRRLRIPGAYLAALLFAVHPVNVESVAWIAQRKNLMAMLFYLVSIGLFLKAEAPAEQPKRWSVPLRKPSGGTRQRFAFHAPWYCLSLGAFVLAMLAKGSVAMLPIALGLLLWWQGSLTLRTWISLTPFALVSAALGIVNVWFQHRGAAASIPSAGWTERFLGAGGVVWFYLSKALLPIKLLFFYPLWKIRPADPRWWIPALAAVGVTCALWRGRHTWGRPLYFTWLYFCSMLLPVMGLTTVYFMRYSLVADHYLHLALIGVVALAGAGWARWDNASSGFAPKTTAAAAVMLLAALSFRQCVLYRDSETLYRSTLQGNPGSWLAHNNLGVILIDRGAVGEAVEQFNEALRLKPDYAEAHIGLAHALLDQGRPAEAAREAQAALAEKSDFDREAHLDLGHAWFQMDKKDAAIAEYQAALRVDPGYSEAHYSLGNAFVSLRLFSEAVTEYRAALKGSPDDAAIHGNLGAALLFSGQASNAVAEYREALRLRPGDGAALAGLKRALAAAESR